MRTQTLFPLTILLLLLSLFSLTTSHSTKYNVDRNETCWNPAPPKIYSFHFHLLFWENEEGVAEGANAVLEQAKEKFPKLKTNICQDTFHNDDMCLFETVHGAAQGEPFLTSQWAVFFLPEDFDVVVPWIMQNRNNYDVLIHPNTGCELEDHTWWALWGGQPWKINMKAFSHDQPGPWWLDNSSTPAQSILKENLTSKELLKEKSLSPLIKTFLESHDEENY